MNDAMSCGCWRGTCKDTESAASHEIRPYTGITLCSWRCTVDGNFSIPRIPSSGASPMATAAVAVALRRSSPPRRHLVERRQITGGLLSSGIVISEIKWPCSFAWPLGRQDSSTSGTTTADRLRRRLYRPVGRSLFNYIKQNRPALKSRNRVHGTVGTPGKTKKKSST